jgi:hypothetical protein
MVTDSLTYRSEVIKIFIRIHTLLTLSLLMPVRKGGVEGNYITEQNKFMYSPF